jgi:hypothetical protein
MNPRTLFLARCRLWPVVLFLVPTVASAVPTVVGLAKRAYYLDTVTFSVARTSGFTYAATLDGEEVDPAQSLVVRTAGYHEFRLTETPVDGGAAVTDTWQFIVKDSQRGGSSNTYPEAGLPSWVPRRSVDAPAGVLDAVERVTLVVPARLPAGFVLPVVMRLSDTAGISQKLMATTEVDGAAAPGAFRIYRGMGSGVLNAPAAAGNHTISCRLGTRTFERVVTVETAPTWVTLSGAAGGRSFPNGSFIDVTGIVTVAAGQSLTFGAGCVLRCAQGAELDVQGTLVVNGTAAEPVVIGPAEGAVWGGIWIHGAGSSVQAAFAFLTGGGADQNWISDKGLHSHKDQQPLLTWSDGAGGLVEDCFLVDAPSGQSIHGESSAVPMTFRRCLFQKSVAGGQVHLCTMNWEHNHLIEMPVDDAVVTAAIANADHDGLYVSGGTTVISHSVFGWCKDDGMDAGSGASSNVSMTDSWFESCLHEGMAWSEGGTRTVSDVVVLNCGQGLECGFTGQGAGTPVVNARRVYATGNANGLRYGDNYDWNYSGKFDVHDSLSLFNGDDVFGIHWGTFVGGSGKNWTYVGNNRASNAYMHLEAVGAPQNWGATIVSAAQPEHPTLPIWDPGNPEHLTKLLPFLTQPHGQSGVGIAQAGRLFARADYGGRVLVRLDRPVAAVRSVPWKLIGKSDLRAAQETILASGTANFQVGQESLEVSMPELRGASPVVCFVLQDSPDCLSTGPRSVLWADVEFPPGPPVPEPTTLVTRSTDGWKFLAQSTAAPSDWAEAGFVDTAWSPAGTTARAPFQTGETITGSTSIPGHPANAGRPYNTVYFRRSFTVADPSVFGTLTVNCLRDDGIAVYLNGQPLRRDNMPAAGPLTYDTAATATISGSAESQWQAFPGLPTVALVSGSNVLAVEVHQADITGSPPLTGSSDLRFDMELLGQPPVPDAPVNMEAVSLDGQLHLLWTEPSLVLQSSHDLVGPWLDHPAASSPYTIEALAPRMFFRLARP